MRSSFGPTFCSPGVMPSWTSEFMFQENKICSPSLLTCCWFELCFQARALIAWNIILFVCKMLKFSEIFFFQRIVFWSRKRKNILECFFGRFYLSTWNLSKLINQLIDMCGSCPCITIYCWFEVWTCHKLGADPLCHEPLLSSWI
jgi:hypothetical protein